MDGIIGREKEEEAFKSRDSTPLLTYRWKITANGSPQEPVAEWMRTIDVLLNTIMVLKPFSPTTIIFLTC